MNTPRLSPCLTPCPPSSPGWHCLIPMVVVASAGCLADARPILGGTTASHQVAPSTNQPPAIQHARVEVLAPKAATPGSTIDVGVRYTIEPGWHLYWNGQNDSGNPIELQLKTPSGVTTREPLWPVPERIIEPGDILNHIYEHEVIIIVPVEIAKDVRQGEISISVDSRWLVCKETCLPGSGEASATLSVERDITDKARAATPEAVAKARAALPIDLEPSDPRVNVTFNARVATIQSPGAAELVFMPGPGCTPVTNLVQDGMHKGAKLALTLQDDQKPIRLSGIVRVSTTEGRRAYYHIETHAGARPADEQERSNHDR